MKHGSLFSGIGGFDLAAQWMGWTNVFQVEWDKYCQKVLEKNFPNVTRYGNIKEFDGTKYKGAVDIISGGFPCQPFSHAGKRKGTADDRYLWPEMLRVIREVEPAFVVGENVAGLVSMENGKTLARILSDLADEGYQTESFIIPACSVGAWHRRDRIWIVAYNSSLRCIHRKFQSKSMDRKEQAFDAITSSSEIREDVPYTINSTNRAVSGQGRKEKEISCECREEGLPGEFSGTSSEVSGISTNAQSERCKLCKRSEYEKFSASERSFLLCGSCQRYCGWWSVEPSVGRVANGIPNRVDRLKGLGNAIVPQVAYEIFKAIDLITNNYDQTTEVPNQSKA